MASEKEGESGVDLAYDINELMELNDDGSFLINHLDIGTIKSKPIVGSPQKEVKHTPSRGRVNLRQQLDRQRIEDEQKKQPQYGTSSASPFSSFQQTPSIQMPPSATMVEPPVHAKPQSSLLHPTRFHIVEKTRQELEAYNVNSKGHPAAAAVQSLPPFTESPAAAAATSDYMGIHGLHTTGMGSAPALGGDFDDSAQNESDIVLNDIQHLLPVDPDISDDKLLYEISQGFGSQDKAESEFSQKGSYPRSRMTEEEKSRRHKDVEKKRRSKEDNAIDKFREIVAPKSFDNDDITARKLSRGDVLQLGVQKLEEVIDERDEEKRKQKELMAVTREMLQVMQNMETALKRKDVNVPAEMSSTSFYSRLFDIKQEGRDNTSTIRNQATSKKNASNTRQFGTPAPEKRKKMVAIVKATKSARQSSKSRNLSESVHSRTSIDSGCGSVTSKCSADSLFSPALMELDESPSPLSGDPLLSTASPFVATLPSPTRTFDSFVSSPMSVCSSESMQQLQTVTSYNFPTSESGEVPVFVLEEKAKIPEDEISRIGFAPSLIVRQQATKELPALKDAYSLPQISLSEVEAQFKL